MSWSLVSKGLQLLNSSDASERDTNPKGGSKSKPKKKTTIWFENKSLKQKDKSANKLKKLRKGDINHLLAEYKESKGEDATSRNVKRITKLDKILDKDGNLEKVKKKHMENLKENTDFIALKGKNCGSVFTEEDFERFNKDLLKLQ